MAVRPATGSAPERGSGRGVDRAGRCNPCRDCGWRGAALRESDPALDRDSASGVQSRSPPYHCGCHDQRTVRDGAVIGTAYSHTFHHIATVGAGDNPTFDRGAIDHGSRDHAIAVTPAQPPSDRYRETAHYAGGGSGPQPPLHEADETVGLRAATAPAAHQPTR